MLQYLQCPISARFSVSVFGNLANLAIRRFRVFVIRWWAFCGRKGMVRILDGGGVGVDVGFGVGAGAGVGIGW
jgi:hypothetical protein